jgi:hypothetical protein
MNNDVEKRIRERAHRIWEEEGKPLNRDRAHWERASREIAEETEDHTGARDDAIDWQESEATKENPELSGITRGGSVKPKQIKPRRRTDGASFDSV